MKYVRVGLISFKFFYVVFIMMEHISRGELEEVKHQDAETGRYHVVGLYQMSHQRCLG